MSSPSKPLRWGIVGCGEISHDFAQAMRKCERPNQIYAFAASKLEKAQELKTKLGYVDARAYGSYEELFADPNVGKSYIRDYWGVPFLRPAKVFWKTGFWIEKQWQWTGS